MKTINSTSCNSISCQESSGFQFHAQAQTRFQTLAYTSNAAKHLPTWAESALTAKFHESSKSDILICGIEPVLHTYASSGLREDLRSLVSSESDLEACARVSYLHGNGFYKLVLSQTPQYKLRLHVWLPGVEAEENIHEHRWHFASTVIAGALHSETYSEDASADAAQFDEYLYFAKDGTAAPQQTLIGRTRLSKVCSTVKSAGQHYSMRPNTLHRILRTNGGLTATLMCQSAPSRPFNRLLTMPGKHANVEQTYLSSRHVAEVVNLLLLQMDAH